MQYLHIANRIKFEKNLSNDIFYLFKKIIKSENETLCICLIQKAKLCKIYK